MPTANVSSGPRISRRRRWRDAICFEVEGRVARGVIGIPSQRRCRQRLLSLSRFLAEYSRAKIKDLDKYRVYARTALRRAPPPLGTMRADHVQPADVERLRHALCKTCAASSVRVTLDFAHRLFVGRQAGILDQNPLTGIEKPARARPRLSGAGRSPGPADLEQSAGREGRIADRMLHAIILTASTPACAAASYSVCAGPILICTPTDRPLPAVIAAPQERKVRHLRLPDVLVPTLAAWLRANAPAPLRGWSFPSPASRAWAATSTLGLPSFD